MVNHKVANVVFLGSLLAFFMLICCYEDYRFSLTKKLKNDFQDQFHSTCSKYQFVEMYKRLLDPKTSSKFLIFIFHDDSLTGGLGDRFSGLISAFSMALLLDRILIIKDDSGLYRFFNPYHFENSDNLPNEDKQIAAKPPTSVYFQHLDEWMDQPLSEGWRQNEGLVKTMSCLNDISTACSLEADKNDKTFIIYRSNRCFLCRYQRSTPFLKKLNLQEDINLYEVAGCMLRLVLWPKELMWKLVDEHYFHFFKNQVNIFPHENQSFHQVAIHHRCGDHHYSDHVKRRDCYYENANPSDLVNCAAKFVQNLSTKKEKDDSMIIFVSADSHPASHTITHELHSTLHRSHHRIYTAPNGCHVDLKNLNQSYAHDCMHTTIVPWFMMALSQTYFVQTNEFKHPFSGYSRSAGIYGLYSNPFTLGAQCNVVDARESAKSGGMSWIC